MLWSDLNKHTWKNNTEWIQCDVYKAYEYITANPIKEVINPWILTQVEGVRDIERWIYNANTGFLCIKISKQ